MNNKQKKSSKIFYYVLFGMLILLVIFALTGSGDSKKKLTYQDVQQKFIAGEVEKWYVDGTSKIIFIFTDGETETENFPKQYDGYVTYFNQYFNYWFENYNELYFDGKQPSASLWDTIYPILMIVLALIFILFLFRMFSSKGNGTMGFGKSRARQAVNVNVKFADIAGAEEEKEELREIVDFLKHPQKFTRLGARIPKGVLLVGPPGTGKTLLARAVAGESGVPFLSISGSDFVEMFVGVGASRVRDLFDQAKKSSPCIIFIDEIDAVGRQRGAGLGGSNDEREQTLNQLLVELDGFQASSGIIVLAATNRADVLDPALLRPGRFDRQVYVYPPDVRGREGIIKIHAKNKPLSDDIDFGVLARITSGFTGADIENMLNESAILAARANRTRIIMSDITEGINKALMGPQKKSTLITENDKKITAYHEAGHAILHKLLDSDDVQEVSIIPRGGSGGHTASRPTNDDVHLTKKKANDAIATFMGGRLAEEVCLNEQVAGSSNDIERATNIARKMVTEWGMSDKFGFMGFGTGGQVFIGRDYQEKNIYSEKLAGEIDEEIKKILDFNYKRAKKLIESNKHLIEKLVELLYIKETVYKEEIDMIMSGTSVDEIVQEMNKKEEKRKVVEEEERKRSQREMKLHELELKIKTTEVFIKHGLMTEKELEEAKAELERYKQELEQEQSKDKEPKSEENIETTQEVSSENETEKEQSVKEDSLTVETQKQEQETKPNNETQGDK